MTPGTRKNHPLGAGYGYEPNADGVYHPVAMDFRTPATELDQTENAQAEE